MKMKLYIENIPPKLSVNELSEWLETYGRVARIEMTDDSPRGGGRAGFVWLTGTDEEMLHRLDGAVLRNRTLHVSEED